MPQPQPSTSMPSNPASGPLPAQTGVKERLFAEQRERYQARYNDVADEVTAASAELAQMAGAVGGIQNNLRDLSKNVEHRIDGLIATRYSNTGQIIKGVITLRPVFRPLKRAGGLVKLVVIAIFIYVVWQALALAASGQSAGVIELVAIAGVLFFLERRNQLSAPKTALHKSAEKLKEMSLAYVYDDQAAMQNGLPACHVVRVMAANKPQPVEEYTLSPTSWGTNIPPETFLLYVGDMAVYRSEPKGEFTPLFGNPANEFMSGHGRLLTDALAEQKTFAAGTHNPLAGYGKVLWRKRKASEQLPRLQKLVQDVDRQENVWRGVYASDKVFEFLLRRIDLFNVRDSATPSGILLYGFNGNGKAYLAKKIAEAVSARFEQIDPATLNSAKAAKDIWDRSRGRDVVLFVDYAERLFPRPGSENQGAGTREATLAWLTEWSKVEPRLSRVWVIMTARSDQDLHPDILAQFGGSRIEVAAPDTAGREAVLRGAIRENQLPGDVPAWLVAATGGASIRELRDIVKETKMQCAPNPPEDSHWKLAVKNVRGSDEAFKDETKTWDHLILPAEIKDQLRRACRVLQDAEAYKQKGINVPNILLFGPPGTGKTEIARTFANEGGVKFFMATTSDMKAQYVGQSAHLVRQVFDKARAAAPAVLFIDEMETVAARRGSPQGDAFTQDVVTEMLAQMDGARKYDRPLFVLAATNLRDQIDPAILSRFTAQIQIPLPNAAGRREMFRNLITGTHAADPALDIDAVSEELARKSDGKSGRDIVMLVNRALERAVGSADSPDAVRLTRDDLIAELATSDADREPVDETARWDTLVLDDATIEKLKTVCQMLQNMEVLQKQGIAPPRGALLYGPPGTGKTQIAKTMANESGLPFIAAGPADIKAGYIGQSGQKVKELFARAREKAPCILFIDEIESGAASRNNPKADQFTAEIVTQLLTELDGVKKNTKPIFLLAATNHQEMIDSAVLSRFIEKIEIPNPDEPARARLFQIQLARKQVDFDVPQMSAEMAKKVGSVSGRDIYSLVEKAAQRALGRALKTNTADHVVLTREDLLIQLAPQGKEVSEEDLQKIWSQVVLKPEVKESLLSKIRMFNSGDKAFPGGLLLYGPPGTGKTEIARRISDSASCHFMSLKGSDLKAGYVGQSGQSVKKIWDEARGYGRCVMFIDECDSVFGRRGSVGTDSGTEEIVPEFLASWDGVGSTGQIWVIGATNQRQRLDDAIVSRFGAAVEIGLPEAPQRVEILQLEMKKVDRPAEIPDFVGRLTTGLAGRDLKQVARDVCAMASEHNGAITPEIWKEAIARYTKASSETVDEGARWDTLVLPDGTLDKLQTTCEMLRQMEVLRKQGIQPPRGALLYGPPGTGKTQIARTIANESGLPFIAAGPSDIKAGYLGQSGQKVHELFERARGKAPCILFVDEIDSCAARRGSGKADQYTDEIVTQMLTELDGVKKNERHVFLLAATNHPELVDEAVLSRFVDKIEIPLPDSEQRRRLLEIQLAMKRVDFDVQQFAGELASKAGQISGRDIYSLVERASARALRRALKAGQADHVVMSKDDLLSELSPA